MSRNQAFDALLAIGASIPPGGVGSSWGETGRKLKLPDQAQMPALFQIEGDTETETRLGQLVRRKLQVTWTIMHNAGADQAVEPSRYSQDLIDAIEAKLTPQGISYETVGGKVYAAYIEGATRRFMGDIDGIEMITVPIILLLP